MKLAIILFFSSLFSVGCVTLVPHSFVSYKVGVLDSCTTGSSVIHVQNGWKSSLKGTEFYGNEEELVFTGVSGNTLHLVYREYTTSASGSYIRPAFSLEVMYDLNTSRVITFRNYVIEVAEAGPRILKFRVLQAPVRSTSIESTVSSAGPAFSEKQPPVTMFAPNEQKHVRVLFFNGREVVGYIVGESSFKYLFARTEKDTLFSTFPKVSVKTLTPIGK